MGQQILFSNKHLRAMIIPLFLEQLAYLFGII